jgi:DNA-binding SARP family transcriptional activator/integrase
MAVTFRLLGEVEARIDDRVLDVGPARQRCVLAALLVDANRSVPVEQLMERVWADRQPQRAREVLYSYLSRLRHALAGTDVHIGRHSTGYILTVDPMAVDLHCFHRLLAQARAADEDAAALLLEQALGLWRGEAFGTLDTPWLNAVRDSLDRQRLAAELDRNDLALRRGQHAALLAEPSAAAATRPLDERLAGQLMVALYRCGRQADALSGYEQMRRRLADEIGVDPSPALQQLHRQILTADPHCRPARYGRTGILSTAPIARVAAVVHRPRARTRPARRRPRRRRRAAHGSGHRRGVRHGRDRQDDPRHALGASGGQKVPRRAAVCQPARLRPHRRGNGPGRRELFAGLGSHRDRALVALFVSTGARASELLGVRCGDLDVGSQLITVIRKGSRALQQVPASPDAFVWLRLYQAEFHGQLPTGRDDPLWWTLRRPFRALTYHAARAMFTRVNAALGANWSLHDLRHTAAYRMARDPDMPLTDVQWVLGHAQLTTTQRYTSAPLEEAIASVLAHYARRASTPSARAAGTPRYRSESLNALFPEASA